MSRASDSPMRSWEARPGGGSSGGPDSPLGGGERGGERGEERGDVDSGVVHWETLPSSENAMVQRELERESMELYERAPVAYFLLDPAGVIRRVNQRGAALLGREPETLVGDGFARHLSKRSMRHFRLHVSSVLVTKQADQCDLQIERHDGQVVWVRMRSEVSPASRSRGESLYSTLDEIDDLVTSEHATSQYITPEHIPSKYRAETPVSPRPYRGGERTGRILVVDDEALVLRSMERVLRRIGYEVVTCRAPEEALVCFEREPQSFDVVVTDYMMPHMTGIQLSERLIAARPGVPILLISGSPAQVDKARAHGAGIRRVLAKPVSVNEFRNCLDQVTEEAARS